MCHRLPNIWCKTRAGQSLNLIGKLHTPTGELGTQTAELELTLFPLKEEKPSALPLSRSGRLFLSRKLIFPIGIVLDLAKLGGGVYIVSAIMACYCCSRS